VRCDGSSGTGEGQKTNYQDETNSFGDPKEGQGYVEYSKVRKRRVGEGEIFNVGGIKEEKGR